jgi:plasmid maintenance system antidote protein VapI
MTADILQHEIQAHVVRIKQAAIAAAMGWDETHTSRVLSGERSIKFLELGRFLEVIGATGLIWDDGTRVVEQSYLDAVETLARKALGR